MVSETYQEKWESEFPEENKKMKINLVSIV